MSTKKKLIETQVIAPITNHLCTVALDIILFIILMLGIHTFASLPLEFMLNKVPYEERMKDFSILMLMETILLLSVLISAWIVLHIRKIPFKEMGLSIRWKDLGRGILFALALYILGFGLSLMLGVVAIEAVKFQPYFLLLMLLFFLLVAVAEEIAMRGFVLGRLLNGGVNKFWALLISSILFSVMHLLNPSFDFVPFLNIVLAGFLLGASYLYTRNLSFPIALHWFWNWLQGPVLGYEVSGNSFGESLFTLHLPEVNLANGGAFGFEGSLICTVLMVVGTVVIIRMFKQ